MEVDNKAKKQLAEHFAGKTFTDKDVAYYCERNKLGVVPAGYVEDYIYQMDFDKRISTVLPLVLNELAKFRYIPEYISDEKRKELAKGFDDIEIGIARILEENGIEFREVDYIKNLGKNLSALLDNTYNRVSAEGAKVISTIAEEKLGKPLTIKGIMNGKRDIEKKLST